MIEFILGAFIYAKIKKGYKLKYIFKSWEIYLPLAFMLFYIFLEITTWMRWNYFIQYAYYIKTATLLSYVPLIIKYKLFENLKGKLFPSPMIIAGFCLWLGSMLNKIAVKANFGTMPTFIDLGFWTGYVDKNSRGFIDGLHILGNPYSNAIPLCNIFDWGWTCVSLGDIFCRIFVYIILFYSIERSNNLIKNKI